MFKRTLTQSDIFLIAPNLLPRVPRVVPLVFGTGKTFILVCAGKNYI
jgi:hypothetical protein